MFHRTPTTRGRIRGAVRSTKRAVDRAFDAAEPKLERAAVNLEKLGRDAAHSARRYTSRSGGLRRRVGALEKKFRKANGTSDRAPVKLALIAGGATALLVGLLS